MNQSLGAKPSVELHDYFAAHAPPIPTIAIEAYIAMLKANDPELCEIPWNGAMLKNLAIQERRWRYAYADEMIANKDGPSL